MDPMDSHATWPAPVTVNDRGFDAAALRQLRKAPSPASGDEAGRPHASSSTAVSYTHLDVYKRQESPASATATTAMAMASHTTTETS